MEKIKAKVEQVLHKDSSSSHTTGGDPTGPHHSHAGNVADPRVDSDQVGGYGNTTSAGGAGTGLGHGTSHGTTTGHTTGHTTTGQHGSGPVHNSNLANKLDPRVDSTTTGTTGHSTTAHSTTGHGTTGFGTSSGYSDPTGPHDSRTANKLDPRVDSDHAGGYGNTSSTGGAGYGTTGHSTTGHSTTGHSTTGHSTTGHSTTGHGTTGFGTSSGYSDPTGPHDSRTGNKLDPRVDSDQVGGYGNTTSAGGYGTTGHSTTGHGTAGHSTVGHGSSDPTGPHDSRFANKLDPRVDSDHAGGYGNTTSTGGAGYGSHSTTSGPGHTSNFANQLDPRVDTHGTSTGTGGYGQSSGLGGTTHTGATGTHGVSNTAGPHNSDLLNKLDPRVDSDRDNNTIAGNRTH